MAVKVNKEFIQSYIQIRLSFFFRKGTKTTTQFQAHTGSAAFQGGSVAIDDHRQPSCHAEPRGIAGTRRESGDGGELRFHPPAPPPA